MPAAGWIAAGLRNSEMKFPMDHYVTLRRNIAGALLIGCCLAAASVLSQTLLYTNGANWSAGSGVDTAWTDDWVVLSTNGRAGPADPAFWLPVTITNKDSTGGVHCQVQLYQINNVFWDQATKQPLQAPSGRRFNLDVRVDTQNGYSTNGANEWDINLLQFWQWSTWWTNSSGPQRWVNGQPEFMLWVLNNTYGRQYVFKIYTDVVNATNNSAATEWVFQNTTNHPVTLLDGNWHSVSSYGSLATNAANSCVAVFIDGIPVNWDKLTKTVIAANGTRGTTLLVPGPGTNITGCATLPDYGDFRARFGAYAYDKFGTINQFQLFLDNIAILTDKVFYIPPELAAITNRSLMAGATLLVTNTATDSNHPPQTLGYALSAKPTGAGINPTNGLTTWRPLISQAGTSNQFVVVVTNTSGLAATQSFWVGVIPPQNPLIDGPILTPDHVALTVSGSAGPDYIIQGSTNLAAASWQNLFLTNAPLLPFQWPDANTTQPRFFYRVLLGP